MISNLCSSQAIKILFLIWTEVHKAMNAQVSPNPLSPHDALKQHFTSLKTDLIFLQLGVLE